MLCLWTSLSQKEFLLSGQPSPRQNKKNRLQTIVHGNLNQCSRRTKITKSDPRRVFSASSCSLENCRESSQIFSASDCAAVAVEASSYGGSILRFVLRLGKAIRIISLFSPIIPLYHRLLEVVHSVLLSILLAGMVTRAYICIGSLDTG